MKNSKPAAAPKPAPKASSNPKNAEKPANVKSTFGTPKKQK